MKHIKEYQIFETAAEGGKVSERLKKKYPRLAAPLKSEFKYQFNRGLAGYFDISENEEDEDFLIFVPEDSSLPPIEFNLFVIPSGARGVFDFNPSTASNYQGLKQRDINSIKKFASAAGVRDWSNDYESLMTRYSNTFNISKWPDLGSFNRTVYWNNPIIQYFEPYSKLLLSNSKALRGSESETVTEEQILKSPAFQELQALGVSNTTTPRIWKNGNLQITHPSLAYDTYDYGTRSRIQGNDSITIYRGGPIRITNSGRPAIIQSAPGFLISNLKDWETKLDFVGKYLKKRILKNDFGITTKVAQEMISSEPSGRFWTIVLDRDPNAFFNWIQEQSQDYAETIMNNIDLDDYISSDPARAAITLKKFYKNPKVQKAIQALSPKDSEEFKDQITLTGNLGELGF